MTPQFRPATLQDAHDIRPIAADLDEIRRAGFTDPVAAMESCIRDSAEARAVHAGGTVLAVFGHTLSWAGAHPWIICSDSVKPYRVSLLNAARGYLARLKKSAGLVSNFTPAKGPAAQRFLQHLGFTFIPAPPGYSHFVL